jgi:hypothetical protein
MESCGERLTAVGNILDEATVVKKETPNLES